jgi:hypothetical protein
MDRAGNAMSGSLARGGDVRGVLVLHRCSTLGGRVDAVFRRGILDQGDLILS